MVFALTNPAVPRTKKKEDPPQKKKQKTLQLQTHLNDRAFFEILILILILNLFFSLTHYCDWNLEHNKFQSWEMLKNKIVIDEHFHPLSVSKDKLDYLFLSIFKHTV